MNLAEKGLLPPYGPSSGTLQALQVLRRITPSKLDGEFLRANRIAPGNEYKVVGALRFLGVIDEDGRLSEESRHLRTRGASYTLALQQIIRSAYRGLFESLQGKQLTRDNIYNYFVTDAGLGSEMATKATRFFVKLCRMAEMDLGPELASMATGERRRPGPRSPMTRERPRAPRVAILPAENGAGSPSLVLAITPEMADMDQDRLTQLFHKVRVALRESAAIEAGQR